MLDGFARHGLFDVSVTCRGDLDVDCHHTIEDIGIALGTAIKRSAGRQGRSWCGTAAACRRWIETLALCAVDLGGRPYFVYDASFAGQSCGGMDQPRWRGSFYAVSYSAMMNLHLKVLYGRMTTISWRPCSRRLPRRWTPRRAEMRGSTAFCPPRGRCKGRCSAAGTTGA